ncbi:hypothetical protein [Synechococcus sp. 1G10]|uniref:hypothetical protein n=1 Tax=Synechococcus sp. 1G10 TaxID=2025605 RepID=UPI000B98106D|nr:hypothetical protein [Synechococcus sp. 1G10]
MEQVLQVFDQLLTHPGLRLKIGQPWSRLWPVCAVVGTMASFDDRGFDRRSRQLNLAPRLLVPAGS